MQKFSSFMILTLTLAGVIIGCERIEPTDSQPTASAGSALPSGLFATTATGEALSVLEAKSSVAQGDSVLVRGRIGGSASPFVDARAMFTIVDSSLQACSDTPGDGCKVPWDYCCEPAPVIARHAATVRVSGADGAPLRESLKGQGGLRELATVVVRGVVAQNDGQVLVIDASQIAIIP